MLVNPLPLLRFILLFTLCMGCLVLSSCRSSDVATNAFVQKRKYNRGFHIDLRGKQANSALSHTIAMEISPPGVTTVPCLETSDRQTGGRKIMEPVIEPGPSAVAISKAEECSPTFRQMAAKPGKTKPAEQPGQEAAREVPATAVLGIVSSITGLLLAIFVSLLPGLLFGAFACILGVIAMNKALEHPERYKGRGLAIVAFLLGIVDIIGSFVLYFILASVMAA